MKDNSLQNVENYKKDTYTNNNTNTNNNNNNENHNEMDTYMKYVNVIYNKYVNREGLGFWLCFSRFLWFG